MSKSMDKRLAVQRGAGAMSDQASCAHLRVAYVRIDNPNGTCSDSWRCESGCGMYFWPSMTRPLLASSLHEATRGGSSHTPDQIVEACASIVDECNREGPYTAVGAASRIRELKGMFVPVIQSDATCAKDERIAELERVLIEVARFKSIPTGLYCWCGTCSDAFGVHTASCSHANRALSNTSPPLQGATEAGELEGK
jgi:sarcosine oxidase delta subunit